MRHHARQIEAKPIHSLMAIMLSPCQLARDMMFLIQDIYQSGSNTPCRGCAYFNKGGCSDYQRLSQVPQDFERRILAIKIDHIGLATLSAAIAAEKKIMIALIPIALHLLTAENPLVLQESETIWNKLKVLFPAEDDGIDTNKLGDAIIMKLQEIDILRP